MFPSRKHPRLKNYDYRQSGCYHLTICTKGHRPILSQIVPPKTGSDRALVRLTDVGNIVNHFIQNIPTFYSGVHLVHYVIMPNHVHLLIFLDEQAQVSVSTIIRSLKRMVTRETRTSLWQDSFYDVIIRNDSMFQAEWAYIDSNPDKWAEDTLFSPSL